MIQIRRAIDVKAKYRQRSTGSKIVRKGENRSREMGIGKMLKSHM